MTNHVKSEIVLQEQFDKAITNYFLRSMNPLNHVDSPHFKKMFSVFNIEELGLNIMNRTSLDTTIDDLYIKVRKDIKHNLKDIKHVCLSTEHVWGKRRDTPFLVVICHSIGFDLKRHSYTLVCRRFCGSPDDLPYYNENIWEYDRFVKRATSRVIKEYQEFVKEEENCDSRSVLNGTDTEYDTDELHLMNGVVVSFDIKRLNNKTFIQYCAQEIIPFMINDKIRSCAINIANKWYKMWDKAEKPIYAQVIQNIIGHTRTKLNNLYSRQFYTYYRTFQEIASLQDKYIELKTALDLQKPLEENDFVFVNEYLKCYKPIMEASDIMKDNNELFYGVTLPCLLSLRKKMIRLSNENGNYIYCNPTKYLELYEGKFADLFNLSTDVAVNAAIAAVSYPKFKDKWFCCIDEALHDKIRNAFQRAVIEEINNFKEENVTAERVSDDFFEFEDDFDGDLNDSELKAEELIIRYLADKETDVSMLRRHSVIKNVFMKFNTPLSIKTGYLDSLCDSVKEIDSATESDQMLDKMVVLKCFTQNNFK